MVIKRIHCARALPPPKKRVFLHRSWCLTLAARCTYGTGRRWRWHRGRWPSSWQSTCGTAPSITPTVTSTRSTRASATLSYPSMETCGSTLFVAEEISQTFGLLEVGLLSQSTSVYLIPVILVLRNKPHPSGSEAKVQQQNRSLTQKININVNAISGTFSFTVRLPFGRENWSLYLTSLQRPHRQK